MRVVIVTHWSELYGLLSVSRSYRYITMPGRRLAHALQQHPYRVGGRQGATIARDQLRRLYGHRRRSGHAADERLAPRAQAVVERATTTTPHRETTHRATDAAV